MIRVMLVDDHGIVRDALYYLLSAQGDIDIVGTAVDASSLCVSMLAYRRSRCSSSASNEPLC